MRKLYIAGPMRNKPNFNFPVFDDVARRLEAKGFITVSPADMDRLFEGWEHIPPEDLQMTHELKCRVLRRDLNFLFELKPENGDGIYLLQGWKYSAGSWVEVSLANFLGLSIFEQGGENDPLEGN